MKVTIMRATSDALDMLLETKNTRLSSDEEVASWPEEKKADHLEYMKDTIKSSWEFVDYIFKIEGVTRAFTHQFVRTRTGAYAQQSMRVVDASKFPIQMPASVEGNHEASVTWMYAVDEVRESYADLIKQGVPLGDARGILPTNVETSIIAKFNLRTLSEMAKLRLCTRTQGEYQDVFRAMRAAVIALHPWAEAFLEVHCVATGTCAFPRYGKKECPIYLPEMDNTSVRERAKKVFWAIRHEAQPIAQNGKAV